MTKIKLKNDQGLNVEFDYDDISCINEQQDYYRNDKKVIFCNIVLKNGYIININKSYNEVKSLIKKQKKKKEAHNDFKDLGGLEYYD